MARSIFFYTDSRELGGAEKALLMLIDGLDRGAWQPTLALSEGEGSDSVAELASSVNVRIVRLPPMPLGLGGAHRVPAVARRLRAEGPSLFHAHMSSPLGAKWGLVAATLARLPTLGTVQLVPTYRLDRSARLQLRLISHRVDGYIAVSHDIAARLSGDLGWPAEKIEVIPNAVAAERFGASPPPGLREELTGGSRLPLVLTLARLTDQKGHDVLLRAAAEVESATFAIAGEGPLRAHLEAEAERLGVADRVAFLGHRDDAPKLLAASDVFALPSLYEGTSLAVLEAMASGRAIVSSAIGGTAELIEDGENGLLVPPGDPPALAAALRRLLDDPALRERLAAAARLRALEEFSQQAITKRTEAVYEKVLGDGRGNGR